MIEMVPYAILADEQRTTVVMLRPLSHTYSDASLSFERIQTDTQTHAIRRGNKASRATHSVAGAPHPTLNPVRRKLSRLIFPRLPKCTTVPHDDRGHRRMTKVHTKKDTYGSYLAAERERDRGEWCEQSKHNKRRDEAVVHDTIQAQHLFLVYLRVFSQAVPRVVAKRQAAEEHRQNTRQLQRLAQAATETTDGPTGGRKRTRTTKEKTEAGTRLCESRRGNCGRGTKMFETKKVRRSNGTHSDGRQKD